MFTSFNSKPVFYYLLGHFCVVKTFTFIVILMSTNVLQKTHGNYRNRSLESRIEPMNEYMSIKGGGGAGGEGALSRFERAKIESYSVRDSRIVTLNLYIMYNCQYIEMYYPIYLKSGLPTSNKEECV